VVPFGLCGLGEGADEEWLVCWFSYFVTFWGAGDVVLLGAWRDGTGVLTSVCVACSEVVL